MIENTSEQLELFSSEYKNIQDIDRLEISYRIRILLEYARGESVLEM